MTDTGSQTARLDKGRHVKYWLRCLKTFLPSLYTSNDSNRMYLAYFILSALDLLGELETSTTQAERAGYADWIYRCQHHDGGFRMWPGTDFDARSNKENAKWDPANIPATYFALVSLLVLGDDLRRVKRHEALKWVKKIQRPDGSFAETIVDGVHHGGRDPRFGYCALGVRHILRGGLPPPYADDDTIGDVGIDAFVSCVRASEAYEGGIADEAFHEPHAGYTFCSIGALAYIDRLDTGQTSSSTTPNNNTLKAPVHPDRVLRWLVERQTDFIDPDGALDTEFASKTSLATRPKPSSKTAAEAKALSDTLHQSPDKSTMWSSDVNAETKANLPSVANTSSPMQEGTKIPPIAGFNGRLNKVADTCYAFWVGAAVHLLDQSSLLDNAAVRAYLLACTQHPVMGGFTKFPGDRWADLYHGYLGLATVSLCATDEERRQDGLKELDAGMCVSKEVSARIPGLWRE